jgi:hypothetical protein
MDDSAYPEAGEAMPIARVHVDTHVGQHVHSVVAVEHIHLRIKQSCIQPSLAFSPW